MSVAGMLESGVYPGAYGEPRDRPGMQPYIPRNGIGRGYLSYSARHPGGVRYPAPWLYPAPWR